jgi:hypothetical protein
MTAELPEQNIETLRLPKNWNACIRNAVLNVIGIMHMAILAGREALIDNGDVTQARVHQLESEVAMLREELRIKGGRLKRIDPHRRPQYTPVERMAILELRAVRG